MDLFLEDILGKMIDKLKILHQAYKELRKQHLLKDITDKKLGLSPYQRKNIEKSPRFEKGSIDIFGKKLSFTDSLGFLHSLDEVFGEEVYRFTSDKESPYIIDCGSNIGLSIIYFKMLFPQARILGFEPDEKTFHILENNIMDFGNSVIVKQEAVWTKDEDIEFYAEGSLAGSIVTDFANKGNKLNVKAIDLKKHLNEEVDFLKVDIEGAENTLIFDLKNHLHNVKNLFLEYHGIIGAEQNLGEILNFVKDQGFQYYIRVAGETIRYPFCNEEPSGFNQQLNIMCYRK